MLEFNFFGFQKLTSRFAVYLKSLCFALSLHLVHLHHNQYKIKTIKDHKQEHTHWARMKYERQNVAQKNNISKYQIYYVSPHNSFQKLTSRYTVNWKVYCLHRARMKYERRNVAQN